MVDKTALNTSHPLYGNLLFCTGFANDGTDNIKDLVSGTQGVLQADASLSTDAIYGDVLVSAGVLGSSGADFGNLQVIDGRTAYTVFIWQISNIGLTSSNRSILTKSGSGNDTINISWASSEDYSFNNYSADSTGASTIVDGLRSTNQDPVVWHSVGGYYDGANYQGWISTAYEGSLQTSTQPIYTTTHPLIVHRDWDGLAAVFAIFDRKLTKGADSEWEALHNDPLSLFSSGGGTAPTYEQGLLLHNF